MTSSQKNFVLNIMSIAIMIYGITMIPSLLMAYRYHETGVSTAMLIISSVCILLGYLGYKYIPNNRSNIKMSVCYTTTLFTWIVIIILSTLPFFAANMGYKFIDCLYESVASWTTTGTSAIPTVTLPIALKVWRSTCNWMGGIGIILLTLSFLPNWQFVGQKLASTEIRGPGYLMSTSTFRQAYRRIIFVYLGLTILQYAMLRIAGMAQMQSFLTALSNSSTSGLQHINNGVIVYLSMPIKIIITLFSFLGSVNMSAFVVIFLKKFDSLRKNSELKMYLLIIGASTILMTLSLALRKYDSHYLKLLGNTFMQVISFTSTSGYIVTECHNWDTFCIALITLIMFIGACAISTGGGIKVSRLVYSFKSLSLNLYTHIHPNSVRTIMYNKKPVEPDHIRRANMYIALFFLLYVAGGVLISADGTDTLTALSFSQAMITNVGSPISQLADPGLVADMTTYSKSIMCFLMLCGRLEIYPVMMLFSSSLWKSNIFSGEKHRN